MGFFGKKKITPEAKAEAKEIAVAVNAELETYKSVDSNIEYLKSQYSTYILKSLIADFDKYKASLEKEVDPDKSGWHITESRYDSFELSKFKPSAGTTGTSHSFRASKALKIRISHKVINFIRDGFKPEYITLTSHSTSVDLSEFEFKEILYKYILAYKLKEKEKDLEQTKNSFEYMIKVIGTDVYRDTKIDDILN